MMAYVENLSGVWTTDLTAWAFMARAVFVIKLKKDLWPLYYNRNLDFDNDSDDLLFWPHDKVLETSENFCMYNILQESFTDQMFSAT